MTYQSTFPDVNDILQNDYFPKTNIEIKYPDSSSAVPNSYYPSNLFDIGGWVRYFVFLFVLFLVFIVVVLYLAFSNILIYCARRKRFCCGAVKIDYQELDLSIQTIGYNKREKYCMMILFLILYLSLVFISAWAYVWNTSYTESLRVTTKGTQKTVTDVFNFPFQAYNTSTFLLDTAQYIVLQTRNSSDSFPSLLTSIDNISGNLNHTVNILGNIIIQLSFIQGNLTHIETIYKSFQQQPFIPAPDLQMPNISSTIISVEISRITLVNIITPFYTLSDSSKSMIKSTALFVKTLTNDILSAITQYKKDSQNIFNYIEETIVALNLTEGNRENYFSSFDKGKSYVSLTFSFFIIIPSIFLVWTFLVYSFGKKKHSRCLDIFILFVFFGFGIYIVIGGVQFTASVALSHACTRAPGIATTIDTYFDKIPTVAGNISIQNTIIGLSQCGDNQTVFDVAKYDIDALNIKRSIQQVLTQGNQTIQNIDLGQLSSDDITNQVESFHSIINNIRVDYTEDITNYQTNISALQYLLRNPSFRGYNETYYNNTFKELNKRSLEIGGRYWEESTIDQLDLYSEPYKYEPQFFAPRKVFLIGFRDLKIILKEFDKNLTLIHQDLENVKQSLIILEGYRQELLMIPDKIIFEIKSIVNIVTELKRIFLTILTQFNELLDFSYTKIYELLRCKTIGDFVKILEVDFCRGCYSFIILGCLGSILMGLFMCMMFPILLEMKKRMENPKEKHTNWKELIEGDQDKIELNSRPSTDFTSPRVSQERLNGSMDNIIITTPEPQNIESVLIN